MTRKPPLRVALFGLGLIGQLLCRLLQGQGERVLGFSRGSSFGAGTLLDAADESQCRSLLQSMPAQDAVVITFPPQGAHPAFFEGLEGVASRRILLGTTGVYRRLRSGQRINEESELKPKHERLQKEEQFLEKGGNILRLAGIYGEHRNPIRWVLNGRVGYERRQVNLVHHDDIARALEQMLHRPRLAPVYNLSDGQTHTWQAIIDALLQNKLLDRKPRLPRSGKPHTFVENRLFRANFPDFSFRPFWKELARLASRVEEENG